jgi:hypothetical protein
MSLQQLEHQPLIFSSYGRQSGPHIRHEKPYVEYCLRHGSCALSNRNTRRCYFECAGSKAIEISLKPSRRL